MRKKYTMGIAALFAITLLGVGLVSAFGGQGKMIGLDDDEKAEMEAFHTSVQEAVESGDYNSWKTLRESRINSEEFAKAQERHAEMAQHRTEMGDAFENGERPMKGEGKGMHQGMRGEGNFGECPFADAE